MAEEGYKTLISYKLANHAFVLGWEFAPIYYAKYEDNRQRDQIKQALRSCKQNIVEGSSERSLSTKLKLYDVAKSSAMEAKEDFEDILKISNLPHWQRHDPRLAKLRLIFEGYTPHSNPSNSDNSPHPSPLSFSALQRCFPQQNPTEVATNYVIDLLARCGYLLDKQMNAVEARHQTTGGYSENLLKKRVEYQKRQGYATSGKP